MYLRGYFKKSFHFLRSLYDFYPVQILVSYARNYQLYLLIWLLPFLIATGNFGLDFGIPSLFLNPEHEGNSGMISFLFMGLATGSFILAFHVSSYVTMIHRYPFIAAVSRPFYVFALNNSVIPVIYVVTYLFQTIKNQSIQELIPSGSYTIELPVIYFRNINICISVIRSVLSFCKRTSFNLHFQRREDREEMVQRSF